MSTTEILVARGKKLAAGAGALTAAVALGATLSIAAPAQATPGPTTTAKPYGVVTTKMGLSARQYPSTDSSVKGYFRHRAQIGLVCKVRTQSVGGNSVWYLTREQRATWVSAKYVTNSGFVKYCKDVQRGRMQPHNNAAKHAVG
ncbi:SH3 domain-containing protein [Streptomyces inhibens]|uniref:SH3 domain-containing protein n=1 Tax=Streptomyces inhibens TaxID=2293571 RepID=UPI001EE77DA3|nr:SH3 domain-containing protein [Streptomyces inhibens]UKY48724.1 SH3 domain-containing protein [Streptomyces inhibens]